MTGVLERIRAVGRLGASARRRLQDQWRTPQELHELRRGRLASLLNSAQCAPHYNPLLAPWAGRRNTDPFEVLRSLPILDRTGLMAHPPEAFATRPLSGMFKMTTSGSSGEPVGFYRSAEDEAELSATWFRVYRAYGCGPFSSEVNIGRSIPSNKRGPLHLLRATGLLPNNVTVSSLAAVEEIAAVVARLQPDVITGYALAVQSLAEHQLETRFLTKPPKVAMCGAMQVSPYCLETTSLAFGAPAANCYVTNDAGVVAWSCPADNTVLHVNEDVLVVEIVDEHGRECPVGQTGEVVLTPLHIHGMPLLRYRIGDMAARVPGACACGRGLGLMSPIQGRSTHVVRSPSGKPLMATHLGMAFGRAGAEAWAERYQARELELGQICVSIVTRRPPTDAERNELLLSFHEVLQDDFHVALDFVNELPLAPNGKFQYLVPRQPAAA